jgi:hypothetical protein
MRTPITLSLTAAALTLGSAALTCAHAADIPTPQAQFQPLPSYSGPPPVQQGYAHPPPAYYGYPPPPVAYYAPPPPPVVMVPGAYYGPRPYWRRSYFARYGWAHPYRHW